MKVRVCRFDAADYLTTPEDCAWFLTDALETKDPAQIAHARRELPETSEAL